MARTRKPPPTPEEFAASLLSKPRKYTVCRDITHAWTLLNDFHYHVQYTEGASTVFIARDFKCIRCESVKKEIYTKTPNGTLQRYGGLKYDYHDEYKLPKKPVGLRPKEIIRQAAFEEAMSKLPPEALA